MVGKALLFKASTKGLSVGDLTLSAPATMSFWLKSDSAQADGRILSQLEGPTTEVFHKKHQVQVADGRGLEPVLQVECPGRLVLCVYDNRLKPGDVSGLCYASSLP
ncbi:MAG: hypothetical protein QGH15_04160 [Kiritimatiellia bacterium]|nr:hypothetical protein [Kiritimatiellia bacterium]